MTTEADTPPKKNDVPVAHAPSWMVKAFGMENLATAGLVVEEPSPGWTTRQVGKQVIPVPPKSEWKLYRVSYEFYERGSVVVLAPSSAEADDAVQQRAERQGDLPIASEGMDTDPCGDRAVEVEDGEPDFEWEPTDSPAKFVRVV